MIHKKKILLYEIIFFKSIIHCYRICHLFFHSKYIGFGTISKINPLSTFNIRYKLSKWDLKCFLTTIKMHDEHDLFSQKKVIVIALCNKRETIFSELLHKRCKIVNKKKQNLLWKSTKSVSLIEHKSREEKILIVTSRDVTLIRLIAKVSIRDESERKRRDENSSYLSIDQFYIYTWKKYDEEKRR